MLVGQLFTAALSLPLSFFHLSQSYIMCSVVCSPFPQGHIGSSLMWNLCRYALMFPCPVSMVVRFPVWYNFIFSRPSMSGKYSFVVLPLVVWAQLVCHFLAAYTATPLVTCTKTDESLSQNFTCEQRKSKCQVRRFSDVILKMNENRRGLRNSKALDQYQKSACFDSQTRYHLF